MYPCKARELLNMCNHLKKSVFHPIFGPCIASILNGKCNGNIILNPFMEIEKQGHKLCINYEVPAP